MQAWAHAAGNIRSGEQYFISPPQQGKELSIFSDKESSHSRYKKKSGQCLLKALFTLAFIGVGGIFNLFDYLMIIQPGRAFQTPGIWEKTGEAFWQAFLFKLPFALIFRIVPCILLVGYTLLIIFLPRGPCTARNSTGDRIMSNWSKRIVVGVLGGAMLLAGCSSSTTDSTAISTEQLLPVIQLIDRI